MVWGGGKWLALNNTTLHLSQFKCFTEYITQAKRL